MDLILNSLPPAVLASLVAAFVATLGLVAVLVRDGWAERNQVYFTAFAAGILMTTALTLFPEALGASPNAPFFALAGYMALYGINLFSRLTPALALTPLIAIGLHSFIDGFEYGILYTHDLHVGIIASVGLIAHEFAEGVILFSLMRASGAGRAWSLIGSFLGAAVATPVGAVASQSVLASATPEAVGMMLAAASGALLYLGATHLPMHLIRATRSTAVAAYVAGVLLAVVLSFAHGEQHDAAHHHDDGHADAQDDEHDGH